MFGTIIAGFGSEDFEDNHGQLKLAEEKPEEILELEKKLKGVLDELTIPRTEATNFYIIALTEEGDNEFSETINDAVTNKKIAVNHILDFIENYYKISDFIEEIENYEFLTDNEKYAIKKFLKKEEIGELKLINNSTKEIDLMDRVFLKLSVNNNDQGYENAVEVLLNGLKKIRNKNKDIGISVEY